MKKQKGWEARLNQIKALVIKLKAEGRYETAFWQAKTKSTGSSE